MLQAGLLDFYSDKREKDLLGVLNFGQAETLNETIYSARIFGFPDFGSSITVVHRVLGTFRVPLCLRTELRCGVTRRVESGPRHAKRTGNGNSR